MNKFRNLLSSLFLSMACIGLQCISCFGIPAFPGAEGFGAEATGGRGGRLIIVRNLNDSGPGSLQDAVSQEGPRIVVFDVAGIIEGDILIPHGDLTIAGESAPGDGITIAGKLWTDYEYGIDNIIVRFLRVRPRDLEGSQGDAIQFSRSQNFILDHVSVAWGTDETVDIYEAQHATIQWCTIEASSGSSHNYGLISGPDGANVTIHHNLFAHHSRRCPAVANGPADIRNNVVYNFRDGFLHDNPSNNGGFHVVGNSFIEGPSDDAIFPFAMGDENGQVVSYWIKDNWVVDTPNFDAVITDPWQDAVVPDGVNEYLSSGISMVAFDPSVGQPYDAPKVAYEDVLTFAGCFPRDVVTQDTIENVRNRTGEWGRVVPDYLWEGLQWGWYTTDDTDQDGMPDSWESSNGLSPFESNAMDTNLSPNQGYSNIEVYLHEQSNRRLGKTDHLVEPDIPSPFEATMPLYRLSNDYAGNPSNYVFTSSWDEVAFFLSLEPPTQYFLNGVSQFVLAGEIRPEATPVYRFTTGGYFSYFFLTASKDEKEMLEALESDPFHIWNYQGIAFYAFNQPVEGASPVYRLSMNPGGSFFYTNSQNEIDALLSVGPYPTWNLDGIAWWAY